MRQRLTAGTKVRSCNKAESKSGRTAVLLRVPYEDFIDRDRKSVV